ncbi:MAG: biotin--[acetyl-CoA-carboxylase] ligase [Candidatus Heimdallarchaeota archaeon]|nr:biotin--[acetyl-CoA-carboxylase] ligase [Candidatus Heimdallarchaeota archaeon]
MLYLTFIQELHHMLDEKGLDPIKWEIRSIPITSSTNDYVSRLFTLQAKQVVVLSKVQEQGRGRKGSVWESPEGGIWLSIGIKDPKPIMELSTPVVEAVHEVLINYVPCHIKEPNDILLEGKKLSGILVETQMTKDQMSHIIIGVGINVTNALPDSIANIATRIADHVESPNLIKIAAEVATKIIDTVQHLGIVD